LNFALANKAPITVNIDGTDYALKRFTRGDFVKWASEIDGNRISEATKGVDPIQRAKLLLVYTQEPVNHAELCRRIYSPEGTGRIIRTCAEKSGVAAEVVAKLLEDGDEKDLETLAVMLASIIDPTEARTSGDKPPADEDGADPLASPQQVGTPAAG
jgi:hypothetical protein